MRSFMCTPHVGGEAEAIKQTLPSPATIIRLPAYPARPTE